MGKGEGGIGRGSSGRQSENHDFSPPIPTSGSAPLREDRSLEVPHGLLLMAEFPG